VNNVDSVFLNKLNIFNDTMFALDELGLKNSGVLNDFDVCLQHYVVACYECFSVIKVSFNVTFTNDFFQVISYSYCTDMEEVSDLFTESVG
jgi:hypothetical protein